VTAWCSTCGHIRGIDTRVFDKAYDQAPAAEYRVVFAGCFHTATVVMRDAG
jgi:tRNA G37 N-methylase TrmD